MALWRKSPVLQQVERGGVIAEAVSSSSSFGPPTVAVTNDVHPLSTATVETDAEVESASISLSSMANFIQVPRSTVVNGANIEVGDIGYEFWKKFKQHGWFVGKVTEIYQGAGKF